MLRRRADGQPRVSLHYSSRTSLKGRFPEPIEIPELRNNVGTMAPSLAHDGLALYFQRRNPEVGGVQIVVAQRRTKVSAWSQPTPVPIEKQGGLAWPWLSEDKLTLLGVLAGRQAELAAGKTNIMIWSRRSTNEPFNKGRYIEFPDSQSVRARSPRYVSATGELFFTHILGRRTTEICVVKEFGAVLKNLNK